MKTALEEALYHLELHVSSGFSALEFIETCKEVYLEKEKLQLLDAYTEGTECACQKHIDIFENYYQKTYNL